MKILTLIVLRLALAIAGAFAHSATAIGFGCLLIGLDAVTWAIVRALDNVAAAIRGQPKPKDELVEAVKSRIENKLLEN